MGDKNPFDNSCAAVMAASGDAEEAADAASDSDCGSNDLGYTQLDGGSANALTVTTTYDSGKTLSDQISLE
jgi:hypothetical protein